jgi:hypothetical protein
MPDRGDRGREEPLRKDIELLARTPRPRAVVDEIAVECDDVRNGLSDEHAEGHVAYTPARISAAARSPERTAPSIAPYEIVAVSVPAQ